MAFCTYPLCAQEAVTTPVGVVTVSIAGSPNGSSFAQTQFSAPLRESAVIQGIARGTVSSVTTDSIGSTGAGWQVGGLSAVGSPFFVEIRSGQASGRIFQILSNTADSISIRRSGLDANIDLTSLGIAPGDSFEIFPGDTLLSLLGTPADGVVGGTSSQFSANQTDRVIINDPANNTAITYFFDTGGVNPNQWRRLGSNANQGTIVISPRMGVVYQRISTDALQLSFTGAVPERAATMRLPRAGTTIVSRYFPTDGSLASLGLHTLSGWRKLGDSGVTVPTTDRVIVKVGSTLISYYFDATAVPAQWRRVGSGANQDTVSIPAGSSVRLIRNGQVGEFDSWTYALPYALN
ncbi:MAG: TIGR02597 family protein [Terrimicrobiaceae bacterium]|nr:TIGR02597 family protein [Terrimicrobiaceae bacterium]